MAVFRRRHIGFVFQNYNLVPILNVYENIVLPVQLDGRKADKDFLEEIVCSLGLQDKLGAGGADNRHELPGIYREAYPIEGLCDMISLPIILSQISCFIMITHNDAIAQLADRIIRIEDGRIKE